MRALINMRNMSSGRRCREIAATKFASIRFIVTEIPASHQLNKTHNNVTLETHEAQIVTLMYEITLFKVKYFEVHTSSKLLQKIPYIVAFV